LVTQQRQRADFEIFETPPPTYISIYEDFLQEGSRRNFGFFGTPPPSYFLFMKVFAMTTPRCGNPKKNSKKNFTLGGEEGGAPTVKIQ